MDFKPSKYSMMIDNGDNIVLFNTLSGAMMYFDNRVYIDTIKQVFEPNNNLESVNLDDSLVKALKDNHFVVDNDCDEVDLIRLAYLNRYKNNRTLRLLIYVTDDCNFSCEYCPQNHSPDYMTLETMRSIIESVDKMLSTTSFDSLAISWFGGEPLLNLKVIEYGMHGFAKSATKYNVDVHAGITTNGYLLTKHCLDTLITCGITEYQITIDGEQEAHDRNRHLKNGFGTWSTIWDNLIGMKRTDFSFLVNLRINVNIDNIDVVPLFAQRVKSNLDCRFVMRIQPIINMGISPNNNGAKYCSILESQLIQLTLFEHMSNYNCEDLAIEGVIKPFGLMCSCSDPNYYVIRIDGNICKCELEIKHKDNIFGKIDGDLIRINPSKTINYTVPSINQECTDCLLYPLCLGLTCPFKRSLKKKCSLKDTFLINEFVSAIADKYISRKQK